MVDFADADRDQLANDPEAWVAPEPGAAWHGFGDLEENWCMLDPIKAGGVRRAWVTTASCWSEAFRPLWYPPISAATAIPSRTTDFMVLCLFTMGITKKVMALLLLVAPSFVTYCSPGIGKCPILVKCSLAGGDDAESFHINSSCKQSGCQPVAEHLSELGYQTWRDSSHFQEDGQQWWLDPGPN